MKDYSNLYVNENSLLYRKASLNRSEQLVLLLKFPPLIYSELHVKMGHLGVDCTLQLIKKQIVLAKNGR